VNSDIRLSIGFFDHPKSVKLKRRLGWDGLESLLRLWFFAAQYKPDGILSGMDTEEIELAAKWNGDEGVFVGALTDLRWLECSNETFLLHDWNDHNGYCAHAEDRKKQAQKAAEARWKKRFGNSANNDDAASNAKGNTDSNAMSTTASNAPSPVPYPSPVPALQQKESEVITSLVPDVPPATPDPEPPALVGTNGKTAPRAVSAIPVAPHDAIIAMYHEILPELPKVHSWTDARQKFLRSRWREAPERQELEWWKEFFGSIRNMPWLLGQNSRGWIADLEWIVRPSNFLKILEGKYLPRAPTEEKAKWELELEAMESVE